MEKIEILEFRRKLKNRKDKFKNDLDYICHLFSIEGEEYLKSFDLLGTQMDETLIEFEELKHKLNDLDYRCEKLKTDIVSDNRIDFKEKLIGLKNRENIIDDLHHSGFLSSGLWEVLKTTFWKERKTTAYELPKWK